MDKKNPSGLLSYQQLGDDDGESFVQRIIEARGFETADALKQAGTAKDKAALAKAEGIQASSRAHAAELEGWLLLVNQCVDAIKDLTTRLDELEKK